jgi:ABC-2 type transport system permease protein
MSTFVRFRSLVREIAITDFKLKYQGLALGYLWSLAKPLMLFGDLIRKVYFPRLVIPIATSLSSLITFAINLAVAFGFIIATGVGFQVTLPLFLLLLLELYVLSLGSSLLLAALYVRFRDIKPIWEVGLQLLFYATPIIYPLTLVPNRFAAVMSLSPIAQIIEDSRKVLITPQALSTVDYIPWPFALIPYVIPPLVLALGYWYFEAAAAKFAEDL